MNINSNDLTPPDLQKIEGIVRNDSLFLSSKLGMQHNDIKMDRVMNSMVLLNTKETEVTIKIQTYQKQKKVLAKMELATKFRNAAQQ